ncbi:lipoate-protein ligase B [Ferroplasma acidarmanus Fer1]|uniref:Probable octanoyltransferase n=2 Tax=Ferroplasma TaxID=74968 RepID=S0AQU0_FERAC|nr:lipoate-protein ligase B [Ferroplasma acidarmanus Fer1]
MNSSVMEEKKPVERIYDPGIVGYIEALNFQKKMHALVNEGISGDVFIFLQHPDVYTAGSHYSGDLSNAIKVNRGGYMTYHGPGQLVTYYIVNMKRRNINALGLIKMIQDSVISLLDAYGIEGKPMLNEKTGVWVGDKKICSIGIGIDRFTTMHGMGLNISTDLKKFNAINPCNFSPDIMTSMDDISGIKNDFNSVKKKFIDITKKNFGMENCERYTSIEEAATD